MNKNDENLKALYHLLVVDFGAETHNWFLNNMDIVICWGFNGYDYDYFKKLMLDCTKKIPLNVSEIWAVLLSEQTIVKDETLKFRKNKLKRICCL